MTLFLTHWLAQNAPPFCIEVASQLGARLDMTIHFIDDLPGEERIEAIVDGRIHLSWICGLLYTKLRDEQNADLEPLAAPVMAGDGTPQYAGWLVVREDAPFHTLYDLDDAVLVINEPNSFSGHHVLRHHLATLGPDRPYFRRIVQSGAHLHSLAYVAQGAADAAVIDSVLYRYLLRMAPARVAGLRVLARLAPFPMPPWLVTEQLPLPLRRRLREELLSLHLTAAGPRLATHEVVRFAPIGDADYDVIRRAVAAGVELVQAASGEA